jgi:tRNA-splicing ligase RtcB (3'-phosphate/5'-hydroxy nucleic acid ligase)
MGRPQGVHLIGGRERELVHDHHNFAWRETHDGDDKQRRMVLVGRDPGARGRHGEEPELYRAAQAIA